MAFPTRHWANFAGTLAAGARITIPHGLTSGLGFHGYLCPRTLFAFDNCPTGVPNVSIGQYHDSDATNIYLSNWSPVNGNVYSVIARMYHDDDGRNI